MYKPEDFGRNLRRLRRYKMLTQRRLGELIGRTEGAVMDWERGVRYPRLLTVFRLANVLECTVEDLIREFKPEVR